MHPYSLTKMLLDIREDTVIQKKKGAHKAKMVIKPACLHV